MIPAKFKIIINTNKVNCADDTYGQTQWGLRFSGSTPT